MIRILVADDHPIIRDGIKMLLAENPLFQVVAEAETGHQVQSILDEKSNEIDMIILDLSMPGLDGLETLKFLSQHFSDIPVLVLSMHSESQYGLRVLKSGAMGYLSKLSATEDLLPALHKILAGEKYISQSLAEDILSKATSKSSPEGVESLSDREFQIFRLIASGKSVSDIGKELYLSTKTVSTYRARILEKMGLKNNAELTHHAMKYHLLD